MTCPYNVATISTAESDPPGCPEPAAPTISMMSRRIARHMRATREWSDSLIV